ncbi:MAG: OPT/YSL family transporter [Acidobacteria bacterium]|nr:OPT/YSL family transporter [Acidobacteriota bacterium]
MQGKPAYFVDPTINGVIKEVKEEVNGKTETIQLERYDAPKATLMSYIIKGILSQELPWGLVLIGAMIAIMLELTGAPALAFAVGLYLPLSTSAPIFVGGMIRWAVDQYLKRKFAHQNLTEEQLIAETDKSNGVLLASGYIAGAAVAGILFAVFAFLPTLEAIQNSFKEWAKTGNPFYAGEGADWLALIPFLVISILLYLVGRDLFLSGKKSGE